MDVTRQVVRLTRYSENARWFFKHASDLARNPDYDGTFVAVDKGEVIAHHIDVGELQKILDAMAATERAESAMVEYVSEKPCTMLL